MANDFSGYDLVSLYKFNNGLLTVDDSGQGNTLTNSGVSSDISNQQEGDGCALFDYSSYHDHFYINHANLSSNFPGKDGSSNRTFTYLGYIYVGTDNSHYMGVASLALHTGNERRWFIQVQSSSDPSNPLKVVFGVGYNSGASWEYHTHSTPLVAGRWYFLAVAYDGSDTKNWKIRIWDFYNNQLLGGGNSSGTGTNQMYIGSSGGPKFAIGSSRLDSSSVFFDGLMDYTPIVGEFLSDDEIDDIRQDILGGGTTTTTTSTTTTSSSSTTTSSSITTTTTVAPMVPVMSFIAT